ncbi:hypothetical protein ASPFODRAFT_512863 [Aspergillus luchuensis CBS 106.47]|uniref:Uncharacterized protein n=1 Tax=Aspergillus luchuensis (strain CBS 106.47) TaxID=1137211 RepID=A0A1M3TT32_ASPLC|nr:hypothetical protein ASPFODRAFT_512863 [Aspergillus luchuensis CBS 106.47]
MFFGAFLVSKGAWVRIPLLSSLFAFFQYSPVYRAHMVAIRRYFEARDNNWIALDFHFLQFVNKTCRREIQGYYVKYKIYCIRAMNITLLYYLSCLCIRTTVWGKRMTPAKTHTKASFAMKSTNQHFPSHQ